MNILKGTIQAIRTQGELSHVSLCVQGETCGVLMLNAPSFAQIGNLVALLFKETEVLLASPTSLVSASMAFVSPITRILKGQLLWQVFLDFKGTEISAIITKQAGKVLDLKPSVACLWLVQGYDITLKVLTESC